MENIYQFSFVDYEYWYEQNKLQFETMIDGVIKLK